jgi:plasmid stabilization system protein ParE
MQVRFHPEALAELVGAMDWYGVRSERAKTAFLDEFERAVLRMREAPLRWPSYREGTRKVRMRRFPFALVYRVGLDEVQVLAVAHLHRRPGYWRNRTSG